MLISFILGILIGAVLGLTGAGGGILAVPALVFGMGWTMQQAAPVALIAVGIGAALGAFEGLRRKLVRYRAAIWMAAFGMLSTPLGFRVAHAVPQRWLKAMFAAVMLHLAIRLILKGQETIKLHTRKFGNINPETGRFDWNLHTAGMLGAVGVASGFMTGLLGVGGGFVMVPMLRRFTNMSMHATVATSLLVVTVLAIGSVWTAVRLGASIPLLETLLFAAAIAIGMLLARRQSRRLSERHVQYGFAFILVVVACGLLARSALLA